MEMICSSVCLTSMLCFSFEKKYRGQRALDGVWGQKSQSMGARGNATSFPLPWIEILQQLQQEDEGGLEKGSDIFPRSGE